MDFYKNLKTIRRPIAEVLSNEDFFVDPPGDWHIVVADITNSTEAVAAGRHADVNLIAAGCLIAVLNVTKSLHLEIPYFFGGDGGTVLVPAGILQKVMDGLEAHQLNSRQHFSMNLRVGSLSVAAIKKAGFEVKLAKVEESPGFNKSLLIGNGLKYAEYIIKRNAGDEEKKLPQQLNTDNLNMDGMECKWDRIRPPASELEVVCYLIDAIDENKQSWLYSEVLKKLDEMYGSIERRHPISINMLKFKSDIKKIKREMFVRYSKWNLFYLLGTWLRTLTGNFYFKYNLKINHLRANEYLTQLITYSEILTIDGRINTIVSGYRENRLQFINYLKEMEQRGSLVYGHYVSAASIMTCYVQNINNKHVHFIDGADGGYTEAAKELKPKLASLFSFNEK